MQAVKSFFTFLEQRLTSNELFAATTAVMLGGHIALYFMDNLWLRLPDRIMVPVYLVAVGFNAGRKISESFVAAAFIKAAGDIFLVATFSPANLLVTFILIRSVLDRAARWALESRFRFWAVNVALVALYPLSSDYLEYGSAAAILALAGWLVRNGDEATEKIVSPAAYFVFAWATFLASVQFDMSMSPPQFLIAAVGMAVVFRFLFSLRLLVLNSVRRPPRDAVSKVCAFFAHKTLEIYVAHSLVYQALFVYALTR